MNIHFLVSFLVFSFSVFFYNTTRAVSAEDSVQADTNILTQKIAAQFTKRLGDLAKSKHADNLELLKEITHELDQFQLAAKKTNTKVHKQQRELKTRLFLHMFLAIDKRIDPNFDLEDMAFTNIYPPAGAKNRIAGISPEAITDPKIRAEYKEAIRKNSEKTINRNLQLQLRYLQDHQNQKLCRFTSYFFTNDQADQLELEKIVQEEIPDEERRGRFLEMLGKLEEKKLKRHREFEKNRSHNTK